MPFKLDAERRRDPKKRSNPFYNLCRLRGDELQQFDAAALDAGYVHRTGRHQGHPDRPGYLRDLLAFWRWAAARGLVERWKSAGNQPNKQTEQRHNGES